MKTSQKLHEIIMVYLSILCNILLVAFILYDLVSLWWRFEVLSVCLLSVKPYQASTHSVWLSKRCAIGLCYTTLSFWKHFNWSRVFLGNSRYIDLVESRTHLSHFKIVVSQNLSNNFLCLDEWSLMTLPSPCSWYAPHLQSLLVMPCVDFRLKTLFKAPSVFLR